MFINPKTYNTDNAMPCGLKNISILPTCTSRVELLNDQMDIFHRILVPNFVVNICRIQIRISALVLHLLGRQRLLNEMYMMGALHGCH